MSTAARIATFAALLMLVFGGAALAGSQIGDDVETGDESTGHANQSSADTHEEEGKASKGHPADDDDEAEVDPLGSLTDSNGYRLVVDEAVLPRGRRQGISFRIVGEAGETVREFDVAHERRMHLIVVRRDLEGYQHVHPRQLPDGRWLAHVDATQAGAYRAFADFSTEGVAVTLGYDVFVPGPFQPRPTPNPSSTDDVGGGYTVALDVSDANADPGSVAFTVRLEGRELRSFEPYLGADGHLVALREGDLAYVHTHAESESGESEGSIPFEVDYPSSGRYRLYFQFKHRGEVRTAAFTEEI